MNFFDWKGTPVTLQMMTGTHSLKTWVPFLITHMSYLCAIEMRSANITLMHKKKPHIIVGHVRLQAIIVK